VINSLFSALTALPVYLISKRCSGARRQVVGMDMGSAALHHVLGRPLVWETCLTTFLLTTAFWLALELAEASRQRALRLWLWFGFVWGMIALTNPTCLSFLPFAAHGPAGGWHAKERWLLPAIGSALVFSP